MASVDAFGDAAASPPRSPRDERQHHQLSETSPRQHTARLHPQLSSNTTNAHSPVDFGGTVATSASDDDLDPAAFLRSVRALSEKREREDNERYRKLEEDIEKGRLERAARREERAKSTSSQNKEPEYHGRESSSTIEVKRPSTPRTPNEEDRTSEARATPTMDDVPEFKGFGSVKRPSAPSTPTSTTAATGTTDAAVRNSPSTSMPGRSNTVKWQQRPSSRGMASRPLSMLATENRAQARNTLSDDAEPSRDQPSRDQPSRDQISAALGARDPSWFRQTADRGVGNAAFRKSKDEMGGGEGVFTGRRGLPGMSTREDSQEPVRPASPTSESVVSETPSKTGSMRESGAWSGRFSTATSFSDQSKQGPEPVKTTPSISDRASDADIERPTLGRGLSMSNSQARLADTNERPSSPTKGMGGFVQSAMNKRSDSVSKRWSAHPPSLSRQNSSASVRSGFAGLQGSYSMPKLDPVGGGESREGSDEPRSRPSSSSSNLTNLQGHGSLRGINDLERPGLRHSHSRSKSIASAYGTTADQDHSNGPMSPPASPSKRWSPNKSSWIESALARPDSPKPSPTKSAQPSWMENIARAKAQRESVDLTPKTPNPVSSETPPSRPRSPTKSTPFGPALVKRSESRSSRDLRPEAEAEIKRSITPPTKAKPAGFSSRPTSTLAQESLEVGQKMAAPTTREETGGFRKETESDKTGAVTEKPPPLFAAKKPPPPLAASKPDLAASKADNPSLNTAADEAAKSPPPSATKPKPEAQAPKPDFSSKPPTTDFRSTLKSRAPPAPKSTSEPEFLSKFGTLRKAQTSNYVAPDALKDNILRGKSGLNVTGGPQKRERKDELRDSLVAKKEQWRVEKELGVKHERQGSLGKPEAPGKPEAMIMREGLGRGGSVKEEEADGGRGREATPEALRRGKSLRGREGNGEKDKRDGSEKPKDTQEGASKPLDARLEQRMPSPETQQKPAPTLEARRFEPKPLAVKPRVVAEKPAVSPRAAEKVEDKPASPAPTQEKPTAQPDNRTPSPSTLRKPASPAPTQETQKPAPQLEKRVASPPAQTETSKMAARFNPGLAGILARGPPGASATASESPERMKSPPTVATPSEPPTEGGQLVDMRKGRARGPKKRKGDAGATKNAPAAAEKVEEKKPAPAPIDVKASPPETARSPSPSATASRPVPTRSPSGRFPIAGAGGPRSAASVMSASLGAREPGASPNRAATFPRSTSPKPSVSSPSESSKAAPPALQRSPSASQVPNDRPAVPQKDNIPDFKGFGSMRGKSPGGLEENKENSNGSLPSVKTAASMWGRTSGLSARSTDKPSQVQLPTRKDEEAAMRSAGLLANSPARSPSGNGDVRSPTSPSPAAGAAPPKPAKSSRVVSGQLSESSPNRSPASPLPETETQRLLVEAFGHCPKSSGGLTIDTASVIQKCNEGAPRRKTLRKGIEEVGPDGVTKRLQPQDEYTLFDREAYVLSHAFVGANSSKAVQVYSWAGLHALPSVVETACAHAKSVAKREASSLPVQAVTQGHEPPDFINALGGILITRRGTRHGADRKSMLEGRAHLGHIVFDEVDFKPESLCPAFAYLVSQPVTLQTTKLFLWKGSGCSTEEVSAAKLAAMDLSTTGEIIEVDSGAEFSSFLRVFPPGTTKNSLPKPTPLVEHKRRAGAKFGARLFRITAVEERASLFSAVFSRRPSWGSRSPAPPETEVKAETGLIKPFTQSDFDPEGVYVLDLHTVLYILIGPLFPSTQQGEKRRVEGLFAQALLFASDYAILSASVEDRLRVAEGRVIFGGLPEDLGVGMRFWEGVLWGTGGLMAGSASGNGGLGRGGVRQGGLDEVVRDVCRG